MKAFPSRYNLLPLHCMKVFPFQEIIYFYRKSLLVSVTETLGLAPILIIDMSQSLTHQFVNLSRSLGPGFDTTYWKSWKLVLSCSCLGLKPKGRRLSVLSRSCPGLVPLLIFKKSLSQTRPFVNDLRSLFLGLVAKYSSCM